MKLVENKHGVGGLASRYDPRDTKWKKIAYASAPFDWSTSIDFDNNCPPKQQGTSGSCGGQAGAYIQGIQDEVEKGVFSEKSARDIYSQIYQPEGGSWGRDIMNLLVKKGVCREALLTSYINSSAPNELFMEGRHDASDTSIKDAFMSRGVRYAQVQKDIESVAQAIKDNRCVLLGVQGKNNGTWESLRPKPPIGNYDWRHWLCACGARMTNGVKEIKVINSWGNLPGDNGRQWLTEEYFKNNVFEAWVLYDTNSPLVQQEISILQKMIAVLWQIVSLLRPTKTPLT